MLSLKESQQYASQPYGGITGNITFVDTSYEDFAEVKQEWEDYLQPETNMFCIVHSICSILNAAANFEEKITNGKGDSYLIPHEYRGEIIWAFDHVK